MASGSSTPTSAGSYTDAEMVAKLGEAADSSDYFEVKEINALLLTKGVNARGKKAQTCKPVALACTAEEVQAFRAEKEAAAPAAARPPKRDRGQLTIQEAVKHTHALHARLRPRVFLGAAGQRGVPRRLPPLR